MLTIEQATGGRCYASLFGDINPPQSSHDQSSKLHGHNSRTANHQAPAGIQVVLTTSKYLVPMRRCQRASVDETKVGATFVRSKSLTAENTEEGVPGK